MAGGTLFRRAVAKGRQDSAADRPTAARARASLGGVGNQTRLRRLASAPNLSRKCASCEDEEKKSLQAKASDAGMAGGGEAPPIVHEALNAPGRPLDPATNADFSRRFGHDFSDVRIHDDARADASARAVGAAAYTVGRDVVFGAGRYRPSADDGRRLLAHELAHTVQQGAAPASLRRAPPDAPDAPLKEAKKEDATDAVSGGLKTVGEEAGKNEALKTFGLDLAKRYALPIWSGGTDADKAALVAGGAALYGTAVGGLASSPAGRSTLSGLNLALPLGLVPYATLSGFSFDAPKTKTDPLALHFSFKGDDLLDLAHQKLSYVPPLSLSFDMTLSVAPDGKVTTPFAMAKFGILPGIALTAGYGVATDLPKLVSPGPGQPLAPYKDFPQPAQPAPLAGSAVFLSVDLLKAPILPKAVRTALGGAPEEKK